MSTTVNISSDLNDYLKNSASRSGSNNASGFMNGWFTGSGTTTAAPTAGSSSSSSAGGGGGGGQNSSKSWFSYSPLRQEDSINSTNEQDSASGWFRSWSFGPKEEEEPGWFPTLSRTQRFVGFLACLFMGLTCFGLSTMYIPILLFAARKFAILFTFGSIFIVMSFAILLGPVKHLKHQFSRERLPFTGAYFCSLAATLYFALSLQSTILTTIAAIIQIIALMWYVFTYIPGGQTGLMFMSRMAASTVTRTLPV